MADVQGHPRITRTNGGAPGSAYTPVGLDVVGKANGPHRAGDINVDLAGPYLQIVTADGTPGTYADLIPKPGVVAALRLNRAVNTDLATNNAVAAGFNVVYSDSFTTAKATSLVEISITGGFLTTGVATGPFEGSYGIQIDGTNYVLGSLLWPTWNTMFNTVGTRRFSGLAAGSHTVKVFVYSAGGFPSSFYWRPATQPNLEPLGIQVVEFMA